MRKEAPTIGSKASLVVSVVSRASRCCKGFKMLHGFQGFGILSCGEDSNASWMLAAGSSAKIYDPVWHDSECVCVCVCVLRVNSPSHGILSFVPSLLQ